MSDVVYILSSATGTGASTSGGVAFNAERARSLALFARALARERNPEARQPVLAEDEDPARCYIAGPMRGYARFNFDAFDAARDNLAAEGWAVTSPADIDREMGFDPGKHDESYFGDLAQVIRRDVEAVLAADVVVALPGWRESVGASAEVALAWWAGRLVVEYPEMRLCGAQSSKLKVQSSKFTSDMPGDGGSGEAPVETPNILEEALRITQGSRQESYGHPADDFERTAAMWSAHKGVTFTAAEVAMFMVMVKLSRERHRPKRDNWVDMAGYAWCGSVCDRGGETDPLPARGADETAAKEGPLLEKR